MTDATPIKPLTREDIASLLGVSDKTIDKMVREGTLPRPWQLGTCRRLYWHPEDWNVWIERQRSPDEPERPSTAFSAVCAPNKSAVVAARRGSKLPEIARLDSRQSARLNALNSGS
jgi:excisionase family DNA binding protein